tara:strand:+ start:499 stop:936 length:438 start_codon:yes stop_codon:yes gene_type:complete
MNAYTIASALRTLIKNADVDPLNGSGVAVEAGLRLRARDDLTIYVQPKSESGTIVGIGGDGHDLYTMQVIFEIPWLDQEAEMETLAKAVRQVKILIINNRNLSGAEVGKYTETPYDHVERPYKQKTQIYWSGTMTVEYKFEDEVS